MLGRLLEYRVSSPLVAGLVNFYRDLGFTEIALDGSVTGPAAAVALPGLTIGLEDGAGAEPIPIFVRPDLEAHLRALRRRKIELDFAELEVDQFHRAGFRDPGGQAIVLVEAGTYSPAEFAGGSVSLIGEFLEFSVPTHSLNDSVEFWESLGLALISSGSEPSPWARLRGNGLTLGLHADVRFRPGLSFSCKQFDARVAFLDARGHKLVESAPFGDTRFGSAVLESPDRQAIYLFEASSTN
jgi:catechol 2,3-dioxygenase-like lactoylglutathione lyase family enzyme